MSTIQVASAVELQNGEWVGLGALEISSIPHISILQGRYSEVENIYVTYKQDMARLLSEVFQNYKNNGYQDIALELLWCTEPVENQPFKAFIRLYFIIRVIGESNEAVQDDVLTLLRICEATLDQQKFEYRAIPYTELAIRIAQINDDSIRAIIKEERLENLQSQLFPFCYSYDRLPVNENDLSILVNTLINYPGCAVSFQLIPLTFQPIESAAIDQMAQVLGTLGKGIADQSIGNVSFTLAERHAATYKYYSNSKNTALFKFNMLVYGSIQAVNTVSTRLLGQLNINYELRHITMTANQVRKEDNFNPLPWAVNEILIDLERNPDIWHAGYNLQSYYRLPYIITAEEASEFFRLPLGNDKLSAGLNVNESSKISRTYTDNIIGGGDIEIGWLKSSAKNDSIGIQLRDLTKHMLIVGTPGSGKTNFAVGLLDRLWKKHGIPFLVIEPAKNEYRALAQSIPDLQVFTPGKNFISPFSFNPFIPPKNVKLETYKSALKTAFAAAVSMSTPLDKIFEQTINNCYSDFRWLDSYTSDNKGQVFNIQDFIKCFQETFEAIGYTGDARNIGRGGVVRLNSLINLFDNYSTIPIEDMLTKPTVIELSAIENIDEKALIISLLLLSILVYVNSNYLGVGDLRNVILLEEAHVLLDASGRNLPGEADPSTIAQGLVKRMLAEIRSYGVGLVIADQSPRKVTTDVVALTDIKLAFRLVESIDKQIIAESSNMDEIQVQRLAKLKPGEAFLFFGKLDEPEEIQTEDYRLTNGISITLSDQDIGLLSTYWNDRKGKLRPYPECAYCRYCANECDYDKRILGREIARRIFAKNFKPDSADSKLVKSVFKQMTTLIKQELNDELFDKKLFACVELHLIRRIRYGTKIKISDATTQKTLANI